MQGMQLCCDMAYRHAQVQPDKPVCASAYHGHYACACVCARTAGRWQGTTVAVKLFVTDGPDSKMLAREAGLATTLSHENVVRVFLTRTAQLTEDFFDHMETTSPALAQEVQAKVEAAMEEVQPESGALRHWT